MTSASLLAIYIIAPLLIAQYSSSEIRNIFSFMPMTVLAAAILVSIKRNQESLLVKFLEVAPLKQFGIISYGFYVYHYPLQVQVIDAVFYTDLAHALSWPALCAVNFLLPLAAALISWRFLEMPLLRRRKPEDGGRAAMAAAVPDGAVARTPGA